MFKVGVSIIICCYNSAKRLPETLRHIALQQVPAGLTWEVLVVNNASTDDTSLVAQKEWSKLNTAYVPFKIIDEPLAGLMNARKKGIYTANYEYLIFCDDDNWLYPNYVSIAYEVLQADPQIGVLGGCGVFEPEQPIWPGIENYKGSYVNGPQPHAGTQHWVYGAGSVYKKSILTHLYAKGWQQITSDRTGNKLSAGGDVEICFIHFLLGYKIIADDRLIFKHFVPLKRQKEAYLIKMAYWQGYTNVLLDGYYNIIANNPVPFETSLKQWYRAACKTFIKQYILLAYQKIKKPGALSMTEKMALQSSLGTVSSLAKNRKTIARHQQHIVELLASLKSEPAGVIY